MQSTRRASSMSRPPPPRAAAASGRESDQGGRSRSGSTSRAASATPLCTASSSAAAASLSSRSSAPSERCSRVCRARKRVRASLAPGCTLIAPQLCVVSSATRARAWGGKERTVHKKGSQRFKTFAIHYIENYTRNADWLLLLSSPPRCFRPAPSVVASPPHAVSEVVVPVGRSRMAS